MAPVEEFFRRYFILQGQGRVEIGALPLQDVTNGFVALVPPMCRQGITNTALGELLSLAICSPRFSADDYSEIGK